jgi:hypothetical protein
MHLKCLLLFLCCLCCFTHRNTPPPYNFHNASHTNHTINQIQFLVQAQRHAEANQLGTIFLFDLIAGEHVHSPLTDFMQDQIARVLDATVVNLNTRSSSGETLLHAGVRRGDLHVVQMLLFTNATEVNAQSDDGLFTALHLAVHFAFYDIVAALVLEGHCDGTIRDVRGRTPVHAAVLRSNMKTLDFLLTQYPETLSMKDYLGDTPLELAQHRPAVEPLLKLISKKSSSILQRVAMPPVQYRSIKEALTGTGKWRQSKTTTNKVQCDLDVVDGATMDLDFFIENYFSKSKPVVIRNMMHHWKGRSMLTRTKLLMGRSKTKYQTSTIPYYNTTYKTMPSFIKNCMRGSAASKQKKNCQRHALLYDQVEARHAKEEHLYRYHTNGTPLFATVCLNAYSKPSSIRRPHIIVSSQHGGTQLHDHQHSLNALFYGKKEWLLVPPNFAGVAYEFRLKQQHRNAAQQRQRQRQRQLQRQRDSTLKKGPQDDDVDVARLWEMDKQTLKRSGIVVECTQMAGDLLFVPRLWYHTTLALEESVAVSTEFCTSVKSHKFSHKEMISGEIYGEGEVGIGMEL